MQSTVVPGPNLFLVDFQRSSKVQNRILKKNQELLAESQIHLTQIYLVAYNRYRSQHSVSVVYFGFNLFCHLLTNASITPVIKQLNNDKAIGETKCVYRQSWNQMCCIREYRFEGSSRIQTTHNEWITFTRTGSSLNNRFKLQLT